MTFFSLSSCVVLDWNCSFSGFLCTSLSWGIVLPCASSAECLYIFSQPARLIPTYFQSHPLFFSTRAVIDLHLSLNLLDNEDRGEELCACAYVCWCRLVCVFDFLEASWLRRHMKMKLHFVGSVGSSKYTHWLLQSMSPVNDTLHAPRYHTIGAFLHGYTRAQNPHHAQSFPHVETHKHGCCRLLLFHFKSYFLFPSQLHILTNVIKFFIRSVLIKLTWTSNSHLPCLLTWQVPWAKFQ